MNSGIWDDYPGIDYWGALLSVFGNTWNIGWAGELWIVRSVTKN